ncbi:50S ribosomal protein L19-2, chloroplastic-like [Iris pallida]|uniref:50S ribosomal protein L19-2, chloroplastic-like n=1 Tax=Iris pallida TaxID=29817 RepID=A0AAX6ETW3_IRIPA|nr:50S ribosomal protein L19-2, chloroplastic-like [Iris pallida]KAJ6818677.1 50S ribosomal protein L19-2, chloroplastic-like [Iris pallida]KAJ6851196.1 50S ribosomal protein L19-2, chloroplastic-like [Iris pallida]
MHRVLRSFAGGAASSALGRASTAVSSTLRLGEENRLHLGRVLTLYDNAISRCDIVGNTSFRNMTTAVHPQPSSEQGSTVASPDLDQPQRIKFKRLDKTAKHIMNILDKEAVEKVRSDREIPDIRPGYIIQMKVEVPENKRRVSSLKGIVIAKRNAGLNSTFRLRRLVAGVGVESVFPLYSPNIKEIKVVDKKKVRRAKLYYLRDRMNALKK